MKQRRFIAVLAMVLVLVLCVGMLAACNKCDAHFDTDGDGKCDNCGDDVKKYTYNGAMSVFPTNWNPHVYQTNTDATIIDYTAVGFYGFDYKIAACYHQFIVERTDVIFGQNRHTLLTYYRTFVYLVVQEECCDSALGLAIYDGPIDWSCTAILRKKRCVQIECSQARHRPNDFRKHTECNYNS